ncbi:MAG: CPBP family intramembrane metalloprotease [Bacteroidales bacterium]|nr:CPBP family intramembrane metalloprotease [Bacteroidales bacterium]
MSIKSMPVWKWSLLLLASFILAFLLYGLSDEAVRLIPVGWIRWIACVAAAIWMTALYSVFVKWIEKSPAKDVPRRKSLSDTSKGFGIGVLFFVLVVGIMMLSGVYSILNIGYDRTFDIVDSFFLFLIVAVGEEIWFRGVVFRWIDEKWGFTAALIVSALLFGAVHFPQGTWWSSLAIAIEAGLLLGAAYKWSGTLWFPIGIHWAWNFFQGNIFGFAVSGGGVEASLIHASLSGPDILTGGSFGAEASIISVVIGAAISVFLIIKSARRSSPEDRYREVIE